MIRELQERPYIHERIIDGHEEWIVSTPLRFLPVVEHSVAVLDDGKLKLRTAEMVLA